MTMSLNTGPPEGWDVKSEDKDDVKSEDKDEATNSRTIPELKKKRSWKKPKDKPMRPLSSYNMFFRK